jgi:hypothetical protein
MSQKRDMGRPGLNWARAELIGKVVLMWFDRRRMQMFGGWGQESQGGFCASHY